MSRRSPWISDLKRRYKPVDMYGPESSPISFRVRCSGKLHTITWHRDNLVLEQHKSQAQHEAFLAYAAMRGIECRCASIKETFTKQSWPGHRALAFVGGYNNALRLQRHNFQRRNDVLLLTMDERLQLVSNKAAAEAIAHYNVKKYGVRAAQETQSTDYKPTQLELYLVRTPDYERLPNSYHYQNSYVRTNFAVPPRWYLNVYRKGLSIVNGRFVLDVKYLDDGWAELTVVEPYVIKITKSGSGTWTWAQYEMGSTKKLKVFLKKAKKEVLPDVDKRRQLPRIPRTRFREAIRRQAA
jgi:hypothetical protein